MRVKGCNPASDTYGTPHPRIRGCVEFRSFSFVVVGDGELGGFLDTASVLAAGGLQDGDDALHAFDKIA